ncbi:unnamed protein product, partial [Amoebophrya sp. A25]
SKCAGSRGSTSGAQSSTSARDAAVSKGSAGLRPQEEPSFVEHNPGHLSHGRNGYWERSSFGGSDEQLISHGFNHPDSQKHNSCSFA